MTRLNIAVVGAGVSGLAAAWLLTRTHRVTLFEREPRLGGHADTVDVETPAGRIPIDMGFIVYNVAAYPNLIAWFETLGVETAATSMSFSASLEGGAYEYSGTGAQGLFGQPSNILKPRHWAMLRDILRFFREARGLEAAVDVSLGDWLAQRSYSRAFIDGHILPMAAAIWSAPAREAMAYPAAAFARFFANHGLLQVTNRPQWRTVVGGSRTYVRRASAGLDARTSARVQRIVRADDGVTLTLSDGRSERFDQIVLACHPDEAIALLGDARDDERRLLGAFRYQPNKAVLHTDISLLPRRRRLWSSWNYMDTGGGGDRLTVSYWMNSLQPLTTSTPYIVTLNPPRAIAAEHVVRTAEYAHPLFDAPALRAQQELWRLQGRDRTWFAGAWCGSGFHEDGLQAGLHVAERLGGIARPWLVANPNGRIVVGPTAAQTADVAP